jgi:hypothetical protein
MRAIFRRGRRRTREQLQVCGVVVCFISAALGCLPGAAVAFQVATGPRHQAGGVLQVTLREFDLLGSVREAGSGGLSPVVTKSRNRPVFEGSLSRFAICRRRRARAPGQDGQGGYSGERQGGSDHGEPGRIPPLENRVF